MATHRGLFAILPVLVVGVLLLWFVGRDQEARGTPEPSTGGSGATAEAPTLLRSGPDTALESDSEDSASDDPARLGRAAPGAASDLPAPRSEREARPTDLSVLYGLVLDSAGRPLPDGGVLLTDDRGQRDYHGLTDSRYSIAGISAGTWRVTCSASGYRSQELELDFPVPSGVLRRDFRLEKDAFLVIRCVDEFGTEFYEAVHQRTERALGFYQLWVVATKEPPGVSLPPSDQDTYRGFGIGSFESRIYAGRLREELPADCLGRLKLEEPPPAYVSVLLRHVVLATERVEVEQGELTFRIPLDDALSVRGGIRAQVVDAATGEPVQDAILGLGTAQQTSGTPHHLDDQGRLTVDGLIPGIWILGLYAAGYAPRRVRIEVPIGGIADAGLLELFRPVSISGRLVDREGNPIGAGLQLNPYAEGSPIATLFGSDEGVALAGGDGRFTFPNQLAGRYVLRIAEDHRLGSGSDEPEWSMLPVLVDSTTGPVEDLEITVRRTTPILFRPPSGTETRVSFYVLAPDGLPHRFSALYHGEPRTLRLAPGSYRILLGRGEEIGETTPLEVGTRPLEITVGE